jgi:uncharacterized protein (TIGR02466 family)
MSVRALFPTLVYTAPLGPRGASTLRECLRRECRQLPKDDAAGRRWSAKNYVGGYTSYGSVARMHRVSPTFAELEKALDAHVRRFAQSLAFDLRGRRLAMTDCWVNLMQRGATHGMHLHPHSAISGTFYVATPKGSPGLKLEDPRIDRMMAAPPRRASASAESRSWVVIPARAGSLVLFESWLRHEVPASRARGERISISFNYAWL